RQPAARHVRLADAQLDLVLVGLAGPTLAAVGAELIDDDADRPAGSAAGALRAKERMAKVTPARAQAPHVFGGAGRRHLLILQRPVPVGQVAALARGCGEANQRLHESAPR